MLGAFAGDVPWQRQVKHYPPLFNSSHPVDASGRSVRHRTGKTAAFPPSSASLPFHSDPRDLKAAGLNRNCGGKTAIVDVFGVFGE